MSTLRALVIGLICLLLLLAVGCTEDNKTDMGSSNNEQSVTKDSIKSQEQQGSEETQKQQEPEETQEQQEPQETSQSLKGEEKLAFTSDNEADVFEDLDIPKVLFVYSDPTPHHPDG